MSQLQRLTVTFQPDATLEFAVTYAHGDPDERCSSCSRPLWYVIRVVYDDARGGGVLS